MSFDGWNLVVGSFLLVSSTLLLFGNITQRIGSYPDPDTGINFDQLIRSRGFLLETYRVITEDGYILTLRRIKHPNLDGADSVDLKPILLQPGMYQIDIDFFINSPFLYSKSYNNNNNIDNCDNGGDGGADSSGGADDSGGADGCTIGDNLGFVLTLTKRFDVWVANSRGVMQTNNQHVNLTTDDPQFWAYSWDEMGYYDLPAVIDFVLKKTGRTTLAYVGFSQGTTSLYVMLSLRPEYSQKIEPAISLAPIAYLSHMTSWVVVVRPLMPIICQQDGQFIITDCKVDEYLAQLCPYDPGQVICKNLMFMVSGFDDQSLNATRLPVYYSHFPAAGSNRQFCHYYQSYLSGRFARYDFGSVETNMAHYQKPNAPDYPLERIGNLTMAFFMGQNDYFANFEDFQLLLSRLSKSQARLLSTFVVKRPSWSHLSFVFGMDAGKLIYKDLIDVLDRYAR